MHVAKGKYSEYDKDSVYGANGKYSKNAKEAVFAEERHNKSLATEGNNEPLSEDGNWAGNNNEPLATRAIGSVGHARLQ